MVSRYSAVARAFCRLRNSIRSIMTAPRSHTYSCRAVASSVTNSSVYAVYDDTMEARCDTCGESPLAPLWNARATDLRASGFRVGWARSERELGALGGALARHVPAALVHVTRVAPPVAAVAFNGLQLDFGCTLFMLTSHVYGCGPVLRVEAGTRTSSRGWGV